MQQLAGNLTNEAFQFELNDTHVSLVAFAKSWRK